MSLLLKMLSRFVIAFLQTSKHLLISWLKLSSVVILELPKIKSLTVSIVSPSICHEVMGPNAMIFIFWMGRLSQMFHSPLSLSSRDSLVPLHFLPWWWCHLHIWGYWLLLLAVLIPACASFSPAFLMMYSAYKLSQQGDNIQPWCTPFPIWNQSVAPRLVLTVASWLAYRFLRRQVRLSGIPVSLKIFPFVVIHSVKGFIIVNDAEVVFFFSGILLLFQWSSGCWQ